MKIIETKRLILRTWKEEDLFPFSVINRDAMVMKYMPSLLTIEETQAFINRMSMHYIKYGFCPMALVLKDTEALIGCLGLKNVEFEARFTAAVEIVWRIASQYWHRGYATEAAIAVLKFGFDKIGLKEIISMTVPANKSSIRVMEKIGMKHDFSGDFTHPKLPADHPLSQHVLYRIRKEENQFLDL